VEWLKNAAIGLSALLAFALLALMAVIGGVAVFLGLVLDLDCLGRGFAVPRGLCSDGPLTQQPVDDAGRRAGQAERQRHAHQHLVAIEFGG
jgi:hypothetical protein